MAPNELQEILKSLRTMGTDSSSVEAKRSETALPTKLWRTISAFANSPGGGVIVLGVDESNGFAISGVESNTLSSVREACMFWGGRPNLFRDSDIRNS